MAREEDREKKEETGGKRREASPACQGNKRSREPAYWGSCSAKQQRQLLSLFAALRPSTLRIAQQTDRGPLSARTLLVHASAVRTSSKWAARFVFWH
jgi:hypothetical protein